MQKILVIDDDYAVRYTLSRILRANGYDVVTAADGARGMTMFHSEHPDVVITDIIMPEQEGLETILKIRRERPEVRIIAISGGGRLAPNRVDSKMELLVAARGLGADSVIPKPFDEETVLSRLAHPGAFLAVEGDIVQ